MLGRHTVTVRGCGLIRARPSTTIVVKDGPGGSSPVTEHGRPGALPAERRRMPFYTTDVVFQRKER
jgi:hypothetical protein